MQEQQRTRINEIEQLRVTEDVLSGNGKRLLDICLDNELIITNTISQHKTIHKTAKEVIIRNEKSILNYKITKKIKRKGVKDIRVKRNYEIGSDHFLLKAKIKENNIIHQRGTIQSQGKNKQINVYKLRTQDGREKYPSPQ